MSHQAVRCFIGLGSNLEQPRTQLEQALAALEALKDSRLLGISRLYRSAPMGPRDQPDYLNAVTMLETRLGPFQLLDELQAIELAQGRVRERRWGPRTLDLDLLLYGDQCLDTPRLAVPHPGLAERNFVLYPLAELAPELVLPDGRPLVDLLARVSDEGLSPLGPLAAT